MENYFTVYDIGHSIYHIWEPGKVACSLVLGRHHALLIDTGYGFGDLKACIRGITDLPLIIVNTHGHLDHAGGNYQFDQPAGIHPYERVVYDLYQHMHKPAIVQKFDKQVQADAVSKASSPAIPKASSPVTSQASFDNSFMWPREFDHDAYLTYKNVLFTDLKDREIIDLGGRSVEVIFLPGHTRGSVVFLDLNTGILFSGDNISDSLWIQFDQSENIHNYLDHLRALSDLSTFPIKHILSSHRTWLWPRRIMDLQIEAIEHITLEKSSLFVHPRTGVRSLKFKYPVTDLNGISRLYIVFNPKDIA